MPEFPDSIDVTIDPGLKVSDLKTVAQHELALDILASAIIRIERDLEIDDLEMRQKIRTRDNNWRADALTSLGWKKYAAKKVLRQLARLNGSQS